MRSAKAGSAASALFVLSLTKDCVSTSLPPLLVSALSLAQSTASSEGVAGQDTNITNYSLNLTDPIDNISNSSTPYLNKKKIIKKNILVNIFIKNL